MAADSSRGTDVKQRRNSICGEVSIESTCVVFADIRQVCRHYSY